MNCLAIHWHQRKHNMIYHNISICLLRLSRHKRKKKERGGYCTITNGEECYVPPQILLVPHPLSSVYVGAQPSIKWYGHVQHVNN